MQKVIKPGPRGFWIVEIQNDGSEFAVSGPFVTRERAEAGERGFRLIFSPNTTAQPRRKGRFYRKES